MWVCAMLFGFLFCFFVLSSIYFINGVTCVIEHVLHSVYLWSKGVCFVLSHWNLPNHNASRCVLGIFKKLLMSRCTNLVWNWLELWCGSYWWLNHFFNQNEIKSKLKKILEFGCVLGVLDLIEFISQFLDLRRGWYWSLKKNCCSKFKQIANIRFEKKNQLNLPCVHIAEVFNSKIVKNRIYVHTWANRTIYTNIKWILEMKMVHLP